MNSDDTQRVTSSSTPMFGLPRQPVHRVLAPIVRFMHVQAAGGLVLLAATATALISANSQWGDRYREIWETTIGFSWGSWELTHTLAEWINDALMAVFFFVTGLEVKRELVVGELRHVRRAILPLLAALGGMVVPASIFLALQWQSPGRAGWGIPMATDIAFVVGCVMLLGDRVPLGLRIMLLTLAIADDIGAIVVIAVGYSEHLDYGWLAVGAVLLFGVKGMDWIGIRSFQAYTLAGALVWLAIHHSGIHATIAGVLLGLLTPARTYVEPGWFVGLMQRARDFAEGDWDRDSHRAETVRKLRQATREAVSPVEYLETVLHPWVAFVIMPLFALANAGIAVQLQSIVSPLSLAVTAGLVIGKPLGIVSMSYLAVRSGMASLPEGVTWTKLLAGGLLSGIGFTMALFIAGLALEGELLEEAKIGVLAGSAISAVLGMGLLWLGKDPAQSAADVAK